MQELSLPQRDRYFSSLQGGQKEAGATLDDADRWGFYQKEFLFLSGLGLRKEKYFGA